MEVILTPSETAFRFRATGASGHVDIIANPDLSGPDAEGMRPMELLLAGLGGCLSIDTLVILEKQRQRVEGWQVVIRGWRAVDGPRAFSSIEVAFEVTGEVAENKLRQAIDLSLKKYCSVAHSLSNAIEIEISFTLNGERYAS